jgi:hypothetical protein
MQFKQTKWQISIVDVVLSIIIILFIALMAVPDYWWPQSHPVNRATYTKCMSNMMNISKALKMYKLDYGAYPETIAGLVQTGSNGVVPFDKAKGGLHGMYGMKVVEVFHCPSSEISSQSAFVEVKEADKTRRFYAIDSYDVQVAEKTGNRIKAGPEAIRYTKSWASSMDDVSKYPPDPSVKKDALKTQEEDYARQLKWRDPADDTVVSWCSNHVKKQGKVIVIFLGGTARPFLREVVEGKDGRSGSRWRTRIPRL